MNRTQGLVNAYRLFIPMEYEQGVVLRFALPLGCISKNGTPKLSLYSELTHLMGQR